VKKTKRHESPSKTHGTSLGGGGNWKQNSSPNLQNEGNTQLRGGAGASGAAAAGSAPDILCGRHLKTAEDLTGFPSFPAGTKSSLMRNLSREIWAKYSNSKDKFGFSFKQAIFSGCQNTDSSIGVYAGSHDSYYAFADLFDKIVEDYHKHRKVDKHASDMDATKLMAPPLSEEDAKMIKSTRIRVGRNLDSYPLGPGITNE
jgi:hypothetical protein